MTEDLSDYSKLEKEAASENTSGDRLWELAQKNDRLALIVAQNVSTPEELLKELSKSSNSENYYKNIIDRISQYLD